jgi:hypothetical protein
MPDSLAYKTQPQNFAFARDKALSGGNGRTKPRPDASNLTDNACKEAGYGAKPFPVWAIR